LKLLNGSVSAQTSKSTVANAEHGWTDWKYNCFRGQFNKSLWRQTFFNM